MIPFKWHQGRWPCNLDWVLYAKDTFLCPRIEWSGTYCFCPVCLFVCLSSVNFDLPYNFWTVRDRDFILVCIPNLWCPFKWHQGRRPCNLDWVLYAKDTFLCPQIEWSGTYCFCCVCLFVCLSVVNFNLCYNFWTVRDRDFIFGMHTPLIMPFQMTPRSITLWPWLWLWS